MLNPYHLAKPLIFLLDAESAHETSLELLNTFRYLIPAGQLKNPVKVMGLQFPNPLGLAAGLDKNADYLPGLSRLGFGFIEVGTVTPRAQPGNAKPRLFRLPEYNSIINRMGFNNQGVDYLLNNLRKTQKKNYVLGINIGKNLATSVDNALDDYNRALRQVYTAADYITINISSPNTPGLRGLQSEDALQTLLSGIREQHKALQDQHQAYKPLAVKIAPDLDPQAIAPIADILVEQGIDALIATNTTLDRSVVRGHPLANQAGGLSGSALTDLSRQVLYDFATQLQGAIPIISAGGIDTPEEARLRMQLGASLLQIYSCLIFEGPSIVKRINKALIN